MTEQLVVRLGSTPADAVFWLVWSQQEQEIIASGELPSAQQLGTLEQRAGNRAVIALAPTSDVLLKKVTLPARAGRKALNAIPYMLEEELSQDVGEQFFALGKKEGDQQQVAVVAISKMQQWLTILEQAGLHCEKLLPDVLALPVNADGWTLINLGQQCLIRQNEWQGMQGERNWMLAAISHFAKQQPEALNIQHADEALNLPNVNEQSMVVEMPIQVLAQGAMDASFNLLQGDFKPSNKTNSGWQQWRLAAVLGILAIGISLLDKGVTLQQLTSQKQQLSQQTEAEFKRAFPDTKRIVNVRSQMRQKMAGLEKSGGGVSALGMLSQLSGAFSASQIKPQSIKFDGKRTEIRIQAEASSFEALEQFKQRAQQQGFEVQQGAINNTDSGVIGSLSIRS